MSKDVKRIQAAVDQYRQLQDTEREGWAIDRLLEVLDAVRREHETKARRV